MHCSAAHGSFVVSSHHCKHRLALNFVVNCFMEYANGMFCNYLAWVKKRNTTYRRMFWAMVFLFSIAMVSCRIDKRLYRSGWHVEWPARSVSSEIATLPRESTPPLDQPIVHLDSLDRGPMAIASLTEDEAVLDASLSEKKKERIATSRELNETRPRDVSEGKGVGQRQVHQKAGLSFAMGALAMGSLLAPLLISGLGIVVILSLGVVLVVAALLALKWSRMALEDMYMARNRYAGKALATAGMILAVLALVALIGVIVIALLGAAFLSVA